MNKKLLLILSVFILTGSGLSAQNAGIWLSYAESPFLLSPGLEGNFPIYKQYGLQLGASMYFQDYDESRIVNRTERTSVNFYNANIGICRNIHLKGDHYLGLTIGGKLYYGPYFRQVSYYNRGGYPIFVDSFDLRVSTGVDLGIYYSFRWISALVKYDTARKQFRFGIGVRFMKRE